MIPLGYGARLIWIEEVTKLRSLVPKRSVGIHDVDRSESMPTSDVKVVRIVSRRDLHGAGTELRFRPFIENEWDLAASERQVHEPTVFGHIAQCFKQQQMGLPTLSDRI